MKINFWNDIHATLMLFASCLAFVLTSMLPILAVGFGSFLYYIYLHRVLLATMSPFAGYANWVTFCRLLIIVIALFSVNEIGVFWFGGILTFSVALDAVDGYLARRFNQSTIFGQYFDMEIDALFVLGMCFYYYFSQAIPIWILIPGILRYVFRLTTILVKKPNFQEKKRPYASYIAGCFFGVLLLCTVLDGMISLIGPTSFPDLSNCT